MSRPRGTGVQTSLWHDHCEPLKTYQWDAGWHGRSIWLSEDLVLPCTRLRGLRFPPAHGVPPPPPGQHWPTLGRRESHPTPQFLTLVATCLVALHLPWLPSPQQQQDGVPLTEASPGQAPCPALHGALRTLNSCQLPSWAGMLRTPGDSGDKTAAGAPGARGLAARPRGSCAQPDLGPSPTLQD